MPHYARTFNASIGDEDPDVPFALFEAKDDKTALKVTQERCRSADAYTVYRVEKIGVVEAKKRRKQSST